MNNNTHNIPNGFILLDKEIGISSAKALYPIKKMFPRGTKVGHAGTLDPFASGLLVVAVGKATKALEYVVAMSKTYEFTVKWGASTDTDDLTGKILNTSDRIPTINEIENILPQFVGEISQTPPQYSAISINGERAYDLARNGVDVALAARPITVHNLIITEHKADETSFLMDCGKGCYVRSVARDMALALGTYGHVTQLRRTRIGNFDVKNASSDVIPTLKVLSETYPVLEIDNDTAKAIMHGAAPHIESPADITILSNSELQMISIYHKDHKGDSKLKRIS